MADRSRSAPWWLPWAGSGHGPLPVFLIVLTVVTGVVDAVSYVALGHVFVANMTGNVVFVGFALAGAPGLSLAASLVALGAFLVGALTGGRVGRRLAEHRGLHLRTGTAIGIVPVLSAVVVAVAAGRPTAEGARYGMIAALALAMGTQNATARRLAVPDLTTTVLTLTLTGIAADARLAFGPGGRVARRLMSATAMFAGALVGAWLVLHHSTAVPLAGAAGLMAAVVIGAQRVSRGHPAWADRS